MTFKRLWHSCRLCTIPGARKRTEYCRKHGIYAGIGEDVEIMARKLPLYSNLIRFHNNIQVAAGVNFTTHDVTHCVLNNCASNINAFKEKIGCIEIMDNVFIGSDSMILYNTRIGPNAIVAAGSVVTKDVPPNAIVAGVPARVIGKFEDFYHKRLLEEPYPNGMKPDIGRRVDDALAKHVWETFYKEREVNPEETRSIK